MIRQITSLIKLFNQAADRITEESYEESVNELLTRIKDSEQPFNRDGYYDRSDIAITCLRFAHMITQLRANETLRNVLPQSYTGVGPHLTISELVSAGFEEGNQGPTFYMSEILTSPEVICEATLRYLGIPYNGLVQSEDNPHNWILRVDENITVKLCSIPSYKEHEPCWGFLDTYFYINAEE